MNNKRWIIGIIITAAIAFLLGYCSRQDPETITKEVTITTPEIKGTFNTPNILIPESTNIKTVIQYKDTTITIPQVNEELMQKYLAQEEEKDLLKRDNERLKLYAEAIKINKYKVPFEDDNIKIDIEAETEGKLIALKPASYTIKPKNLVVPVDIPKPKEKVFSMNMGAYSTYDTSLKTFDPGAKIELEFKGGHNFTAGYSLNRNIMAGYAKEIFSIKK